jgi:hypothetical protein
VRIKMRIVNAVATTMAIATIGWGHLELDWLGYVQPSWGHIGAILGQLVPYWAS